MKKLSRRARNRPGSAAMFSTYIYLTAAYAQQGEDVKAVAAREQLFKLWPNFALARWKFLTASDSPVYWQQLETHLFTGLRKAGVPEG